MTIKRDSQNAAILLHLTKGKSLTRYEAILMFRVQNITARLSDLRKLVKTLVPSDGECGLHTIQKTDPNGQTYAEYRIECRRCRQRIGSFLSGLRRRAA